MLPPHEDLFPHVVAERAEHKVNLEAIEADGEVALGWRSTALKTRQETGTGFILHLFHVDAYVHVTSNVYLCVAVYV